MLTDSRDAGGTGPAAPTTAWRRLLAFGRRWPSLYRRAHVLALCLLPVELVTGACLYFPRLHTALIPLLPAIERLHDWIGAAFGVLLLLPVAVPLGRRLLSVLDWNAALWLGSGLTLTGLFLWSGATWPLLRAGAFGLHGVLAVLLLAWVSYHAAVRVEAAARGGDPERALERRRPMGRREMARALAGAVGGGALATLVFGASGSALGALLARAARPLAETRPRPAATRPVVRSGRARAAPAVSAPIPGFQLYSVVGYFPSYDPGSYRLVVDGDVAHPVRLTLEDLTERLPQVTETRNFRCVTGWEVVGVRWQGVRLADLARLVQPAAHATWLTFHSFDGVYVDSLSLAQATADGVLLAHHADGAPLAPQQGAPLRLVVPQMYGYKSVKWVGRIVFGTQRVLGYWEQRGYGPDAYLGTPFGWPPGETPAQFGLPF